MRHGDRFDRPTMELGYFRCCIYHLHVLMAYFDDLYCGM